MNFDTMNVNDLKSNLNERDSCLGDVSLFDEVFVNPIADLEFVFTQPCM